MRVGLIGQKWIGAEVFTGLPSACEVAFVAAPDAGDRLAVTAARSGHEVFMYSGRGLRDLPCDRRCDLLISVGSFEFVPRPVRDAAGWSIGYHPSLLPLYRGPRAVEEAVAAGESVTGGTVYHLTDDFDAGSVVFQDWCFVRKGETSADLWRRALAPMGVDLILRAVDHLHAYGFLPAEEQAVA